MYKMVNLLPSFYSACLVLLSTLIVIASSHEASNPLTQHQEVHEHGPPHVQQHQQQPPHVQQHHQQPPHQASVDAHQPPEHNANDPVVMAGRHQPRMDHQTVHNQEHIKEHLDGKINAEENMSEEELQFHYFKVHDYDNNNMLDGIELVKALTHHHRAEEGNEQDNRGLSNEELMSTVDNILKDNDANSDGYIDYPEFIVGQRSSS